ncbi:MAG: cytochrome b N-terminal domain-containing protein, partial [Blastocatellia bacterium]
TNIISAMPVLGKQIRFMLLGGNLVGENALLRFYVLHCVILPLIAVLLIGVHFWRIRKDGGLTVPSKE